MAFSERFGELEQTVTDGRLTLMRLVEFATRRERVYRHRWTRGDLVIWDNRCTLHLGLPHDPRMPAICAERRFPRRGKMHG